MFIEEKAVKMQNLNMYEAPSVQSLDINLNSAQTDKKPFYKQVSNSVKRKGGAFRGTKFSAIIDRPRNSTKQQMILGTQQSPSISN